MTPARSTAGASLAEALAPVVADPARSAVLLDIDGTLAPIVERADDAHVPERTRSLLIEIARRYACVACVSGRRASDARRLVSIGTINYLGSHGVELLRAGWAEPALDPGVAEWTRRVADFARSADQDELRHLRVRQEDKGAIVAFHWRGAPDEGAAQSAMDGLAASAEGVGLRTHWGRKVLEIRPPVRMDKGVGIFGFLEGAGLDVALYAGDDATDLDAFRGLGDLIEAGRLRTAVRAGVRSEEGPAEIAEKADVVVDGTEGVVALLEALLG